MTDFVFIRSREGSLDRVKERLSVPLRSGRAWSSSILEQPASLGKGLEDELERRFDRTSISDTRSSDRHRDLTFSFLRGKRPSFESRPQIASGSALELDDLDSDEERRLISSRASISSQMRERDREGALVADLDGSDISTSPSHPATPEEQHSIACTSTESLPIDMIDSDYARQIFKAIQPVHGDDHAPNTRKLTCPWRRPGERSILDEEDASILDQSELEAVQFVKMAQHRVRPPLRSCLGHERSTTGRIAFAQDTDAGWTFSKNVYNRKGTPINPRWSDHPDARLEFQSLLQDFWSEMTRTEIFNAGESESSRNWAEMWLETDETIARRLARRRHILGKHKA